MRKLLLAALNAMGTLLTSLPAIAQISTDTTTFNGEIAASCSMSLGNLIEMTYYANSNQLSRSDHMFELNTNSPNVRMSVSRVTVNTEPQPIASSIEPYVMLYFYSNSSNTQTQVASGTKDTTLTSNSLETSTSSANNFRLVTGVNTSQKTDNQYELPSGSYSYSVTISCLL